MTNDTLWRKIPGGLLILEGIVHLGIAIIAYGFLTGAFADTGNASVEGDCLRSRSLFA